ncbi:unnamed protein product [Pleuronectes platessa]|uniref:Uncharacterized protein n=1 Tax=Pleuronectes platessa TaxID=8262 RepID=A0A9N7VCW2_PLEPL|nr:unnamed protein product [Pleuronectes platessa]
MFWMDESRSGQHCSAPSLPPSLTPPPASALHSFSPPPFICTYLRGTSTLREGQQVYCMKNGKEIQKKKKSGVPEAADFSHCVGVKRNDLTTEPENCCSRSNKELEPLCLY